jgi:AcrR family transcriptional regulator
MASTTSSRSYDGSRRQAEALQRKRRVIDAAHRLFLEQGYGETSIAQIAAAADVSPQTVYASFTSKAGVLAKVADVVVAGDYAAVESEDGPLVRDRHAMNEALDAPDLRVRLPAIAHYARLGHARSAPVLHLVDTAAGSDPAIAALLANLLAGMHEDIQIAVAAMPLDQLRPGLDHQTATGLCYHLLGWRSYVALVMECGWTDDQYEQRLAEAIVHLLLPDDA